MGFNTEVRKALDADIALRRRFGALRSAVQRFSPNGFNATFKNLEEAVGVSDPDNWSEEEIVQAAEMLRESRVRYMDYRATWDDGRRTHKAQGIRQPSTEERDAVGDQSWCDHISSSTSPRPRYRWVSLADWVLANGLAPGPVGHDIGGVLRTVLERIPPSQHEPTGSMLAHYGPFPSPMEPANVIEIPYRIYNDPLPETEYRSLSAQQRVIADCWYTRSHDGYVRQHHLKRLIPSEEYWAVPYVVAALGDYVVEIVQEVELGLIELNKPASWHDRAYRQFAANNHDFIELVRQRATSYQHCYHSASFSRTGGDEARPVYPAFPALDQISDADTYPRQYRVPRT